MATMEEKMEAYKAQLEELGVSIDEDMLAAVAEDLGPANYNPDASLVSCSDDTELERVYTNFVSDELEVSDKEEGMAAIKAVCEQMDGIARKHRAVFYYLLAKNLGTGKYAA